MFRIINKVKYLLFIDTSNENLNDNENNDYKDNLKHEIFRYDLHLFDEEINAKKYQKRIQETSYLSKGKIIEQKEIKINGLSTTYPVYLYGLNETGKLAIVGISNGYENKFTVTEFKNLVTK